MAELVGRSPHAAWVESADRVVICLLDRLGSLPVVLTDSGADLWLALAQPRSTDDLAREMADLHGIDVAVVAADLAGFVDEMVACGVAVRTST